MSVVKLETDKDRSNAAVLELLADLTKLAEAGELLSIGVCGVMDKWRVCSHVAGGEDNAALLGASMQLQDRIKARFE